MSADKGMWVLLEQKALEVQEASLEVVSGSRKLADDLKEEVCGVVLGSDIAGIADALTDYGIDKIYLLDSPQLAIYSGEIYTEALANLLQEQNPRMFLCAATSVGKDLAPRIAARLKAGFVSDCVDLGLDEEGLLLQTKPTYGGKVYSTITCPNSAPNVATVRPGVIKMKKLETGNRPEVIPISPQLSQKEPRAKSEGFIKADPKDISLDEAEIVLAGGQGIGSYENFKLLEGLADILGGSIGASLKPVDEGWVDRNRLVGQTGITVNPNLYIACGISGAVHHTLGMKDSKVIIAINKDRYAPIFQVADVGIIGDVKEVIPAITNKLRELKKSTKDNTKGVSGREV
ncbi:electron transfer flavoprotein subunit alpha/FixB family protein [Chloroflexota bacterium]